jgi:hypothetical protein
MIPKIGQVRVCVCVSCECVCVCAISLCCSSLSLSRAARDTLQSLTLTLTLTLSRSRSRSRSLALSLLCLLLRALSLSRVLSLARSLVRALIQIYTNCRSERPVSLLKARAGRLLCSLLRLKHAAHALHLGAQLRLPWAAILSVSGKLRMRHTRSRLTRRLTDIKAVTEVYKQCV